jgi:hypothetical protein
MYNKIVLINAMPIAAPFQTTSDFLHNIYSLSNNRIYTLN